MRKNHEVKKKREQNLNKWVGAVAIILHRSLDENRTLEKKMMQAQTLLYQGVWCKEQKSRNSPNLACDKHGDIDNCGGCVSNKSPAKKEKK